MTIASTSIIFNFWRTLSEAGAQLNSFDVELNTFPSEDIIY